MNSAVKPETIWVYKVGQSGKDYYFKGTCYTDVEEQCRKFFKCTTVNDNLMPYHISRIGKLETI